MGRQQSNEEIILESGKWAGSCPSVTSTQPLSCETKPFCTQEIGQLCNPNTKIIGIYTDGCIKQSFIKDGFISDLSKCKETPPPPPQGCPLYSPLQCGTDEELVLSADSAGCPTSKCVKIEGLPIWIYAVVIGAIILGIGGILYFNRKKKKKK